MPPLAHRLTAVVGIALVLALNLLAVCPGTHAWFHALEKAPLCAHDHAPGGSPDHAVADDCIVVQFAHGGGGLPLAPASVSPPLPVRFASPAIAGACGVRAPAHEFPPCCGPPAV